MEHAGTRTRWLASAPDAPRSPGRRGTCKYAMFWDILGYVLFWDILGYVLFWHSPVDEGDLHHNRGICGNEKGARREPIGSGR